MASRMAGPLRLRPPASSSSASPGGDGLALSWLGRIHPPSSDDDVRRGEEDGDGGDDGEGREGDEAEPVDHHRRELHAHSARTRREGSRSLAAAPSCTISI